MLNPNTVVSNYISCIHTLTPTLLFCTHLLRALLYATMSKWRILVRSVCHNSIDRESDLCGSTIDTHLSGTICFHEVTSGDQEKYMWWGLYLKYFTINSKGWRFLSVTIFNPSPLSLFTPKVILDLVKDCGPGKEFVAFACIWCL